MTSIGSWTFSECIGLTFITIPGSVTTIGYCAFSGCIGLTTITIPGSVAIIDDYAFSGCSSLVSVVISEGVTSIGGSAFFECSSLTSVTIPEGVTTIGDNAFQNCSGLDSITIPGSVTIIEDYVFSDCSSLASVVIPEGVTSIGDDVFSNCNNLTSVKIPQSVTKLGRWIFSGCSSLTSVTIPEGVANIGTEVFQGCSGMNFVTIPSSVKSIGWNSFASCSNLKNLYCYADNIPETDLTAFDSTPIQSDTLYVPASALEQYKTTAPWNDFGTILALEGEPSDSILHDGDIFTVRTIEGVEMTFKVISTSDSTCQVGIGAIETMSSAIPGETKGCVTIPNTARGFEVIRIGDGAFYGCNQLHAVAVPNSVTNIGSNVWGNCPSLSAIEWNAEINVPDDMLGNGRQPNLLLYVQNEDIAKNVNLDVNVIVNDHTDGITLMEDYNFYAPRPFTADEISYTHTYTMESGMGESQGWETIALPFGVQTITHETAGTLTSFALYQEASGEKPFWLSTLTDAGWQAAERIEANKPYIICMPNNEAYDEEYNVAGTVTFSARNVTVPKTEAIVGEGNGMRLIPALQSVEGTSSVFTVNRNEDYNGFSAGSVFVRNLRDVRPFEAYITQDAGAKQRNVIRIVEENATGIDFARSQPMETENVVYDLTGRQVKSPQRRGVYIVNKKMMLVR